MDLRLELAKAAAAGQSIAAIAKKIECDPSLLHKWLKGERNLSKEKQEKVLTELRYLKSLWNDINV